MLQDAEHHISICCMHFNVHFWTVSLGNCDEAAQHIFSPNYISSHSVKHLQESHTVTSVEPSLHSNVMISKDQSEKGIQGNSTESKRQVSASNIHLKNLSQRQKLQLCEPSKRTDQKDRDGAQPERSTMQEIAQDKVLFISGHKDASNKSSLVYVNYEDECEETVHLSEDVFKYKAFAKNNISPPPLKTVQKDVPSQFFPSKASEKPAVQEHWYDPGVLSQQKQMMRHQLQICAEV
ncbi:hypothetical protein DNTS_025816 [Danionella cerebrum]|uniref:Uncharacterized protein n=1 Tax=Danionella cerebrum TaxID=2873325 RepID=A0A553QLM2_9TELE|nr:hypothetical protein DNTS_025816 [Danionella translucida]